MDKKMENYTYTESYMNSPYIDDYTIAVIARKTRRYRARCIVQTLKLINDRLKHIEMEMTLTVPIENKVDHSMPSEMYLITNNKVYDMMSRNVFKRVDDLDKYLTEFYKFTLAL